MPTLFDPIRLGALDLPNRILMAPLTRCRATPDTRVPTRLMRDYYVQRASAGLIFSEATSVDADGRRLSPHAGHLVRRAGRGLEERHRRRARRRAGACCSSSGMSAASPTPIYLGGAQPVAPSAIAPGGHVSLVRPPKPFVTPRALETDEIPGIVEAYRKGAENAAARRLRRRRDPRRQWLPARPVPAGQHATSAPTATAARSRTARA